MNKTGRKIIIIVCLLAAIAVVVFAKHVSQKSTYEAVAETEVEKHVSLPMLLELGSDSCKPCKMMAPILDELKKEYSDRFVVKFIDVWQDEAAGRRYGVRVIPTQIFFDAAGKELFRHQGFYPKESIIARWKQFGVALEDDK